MKEKAQQDLPPGMEMDISSLDGEYELEAEGELMWNVETGLVHGLHLSGQTRMIVDTSMSVSFNGQNQAMEMSQTFAGNQTITLSTGD